MKSINRILLITLASQFSFSCHTMMESTLTPYTNYNYQPTKNDKGETVYKSEQVSYQTQPIQPAIQVVTPSEHQSVKPQQLQNSDDGFKPHSSAVFIEAAKDHDQFHLGIHYGIFMENNVVLFRGGTSLFSSGDENYLGFDFSARAYLRNNFIEPFVGLGGYIGDIKKCVYDFNLGRNICEKKFLNAGYGEIGLQKDWFQIFWRDYNISRAGVQVPSESTLGIGVVF